MTSFTAAVEGFVDEVVLSRMASDVGLDVQRVYQCGGKASLVRRLNGFNAAAMHAPWVVMVDLDRNACAVTYRAELLPQPAPGMALRIAIRQVESWLLADREQAARWLSVNAARIPSDPERMDSPKAALVELARSSRRRRIRDSLVPSPTSGRQVGPQYVAEVTAYVQEHWRPDVARASSRSLDGALRALERLRSGQ